MKSCSNNLTRYLLTVREGLSLTNYKSTNHKLTNHCGRGYNEVVFEAQEFPVTLLIDINFFLRSTQEKENLKQQWTFLKQFSLEDRFLF